MGRELVPVGGNRKIAVVATRVASALKTVGQAICTKMGGRSPSISRDMRRDDVDVVDVECRIPSSDKTQEVVKALHEQRFLDAAELLHSTDVDMEDSELLYLMGVNQDKLSELGMIFDFAHAVERSALKGYPDAQFAMARKELDSWIETRYLDTDGVRSRIIDWLERASISGCAKASLTCARIFFKGGTADVSLLREYGSGMFSSKLWDPVRNVYKAKEFYERAKQQGSLEAEKELADLIRQYNSGSMNGSVGWK